MSDIPILKVGDVLLVSIQTDLNDTVANSLQESILRRIQETGASALVIDISSLGLVDSYIGRVLSETARLATLLNADVCLVGVQPSVAMTIVELGLVFDEVKTALNLELGLEFLGYGLQKIERAEPQAENVERVPAELSAR